MVHGLVLLKRGQRFLLAVAVTLWTLLRFPPWRHAFPDDTAIVFRYLDLFRQGYFFHYNRSGPPVFGVSGFFHGLLAGGLTWAGISPERSVLVVNAGASLCFFYALAGLFERALRSIPLRAGRSTSPALGAAAVAAVAIASSYVPVTFFLGLEAPLQVALVTCALASWQSRGRYLPLLLALALISKLDALALVGTLLASYIVRAWLGAPRASRGRVVRILLGRVLVQFVLPLAVWTVFATLVFGSVVPQTFIAKNLFHNKPPGFFPFLEGFIGTNLRTWSAGAVLLLALLGAAWSLVRGRWLSASVVFTVCAVGTLAQYWYFNPAERMSWYYTLPETLFLVAAIVGLQPLTALWKRHRGLLAVAIAVLAGVVGCRYVVARDLIELTEPWLRCIEGERATDVASYVEHRFAPGEVVLVGHGYPARAAKDQFVVDYTGLNSPAATDRKLDRGRMFDELRVDWFVGHGLSPLEVQRSTGMSVERIFYATQLGGFEPMLVEKLDRSPAHRTVSFVVPETALRGGDVIRRFWSWYTLRGAEVAYDLEWSQHRMERPLAVRFGVARNSAAREAVIELDHGGGTLRQTCAVEPIADAMCADRTASECRVELAGVVAPRALRVRAKDGAPVIVTSPLWTEE